LIGGVAILLICQLFAWIGYIMVRQSKSTIPEIVVGVSGTVVAVISAYAIRQIMNAEEIGFVAQMLWISAFVVGVCQAALGALTASPEVEITLCAVSGALAAIGSVFAATKL
jgi:hypothetical protein